MHYVWALERMAREGAVVIFSISGCCMCLALKRLFSGLGVHPTVFELDHLPNGSDLHTALFRILPPSPTSSSSSSPVPVVFVGGKLLGSMEVVMASHINGSLVPLLKQAGALWL